MENVNDELNFNELYANRNSILNKVSQNELLSALESTYVLCGQAIEFLDIKIKKCKDILKYNPEDTVVKEELEQYEFILFVVKYNYTMIGDDILKKGQKQ